MMGFSRLLLAAALLPAVPAAAQNLISTGASSGLRLYMTNGNDFWMDPTSGALVFKVNGNAVSTMTPEGYWLVNGINAINNTGLTVSSVTTTITGNTQHSIRSSSGVLVNAGGVTAAFFNGAHFGSGAGLTGVTGTDSTRVLKTGDSMSGALTMSGNTANIVSGASVTTGGGLFGATAVLTSSAGVGVAISTWTGRLNVLGAGVGRMIVGPTGCGGDYTGITLNNSDQPNTCSNYNILSSPSDQQLYINRPTGRAIYFRENNNTQMSILAGGGVVTGGATAASGSGNTDLTATGAVYFGTGGSFRVTSAGAATTGVTRTGNQEYSVAAAANHFHTAVNWSGAVDSQKIFFATGSAAAANGLCSISGAGNLRCRGSLSSNVAPDVAEHVQAEPDVEPYEVVALSDAQGDLSGHWGERVKVRRAAKPYEAGLIGVIAGPDSGLVIGAGFLDEDGKARGTLPLALAGRVPVKVTLEGGPIKPGDALTASSTPGRAMRAGEPGATIGVALESFEGPGEGRVMVFVDVGERGMGFYRERLRRVEDENRALERRLERLEARLGEER
jgi:hypothetical protein